MTDPKDRQKKTDEKAPQTPSAGPHAKPELTNPDATPGTGSLPPVGEDEENMQPTS